MSEQNILIYSSDTAKIAYILNEAKKLQANFGAEKILVLLAGESVIAEAHKIVNCGADTIISVVTDNSFPETISFVIKKIMEKHQANTVVMIDQSFEIEVAGRLSTKLEASCLTNCLSVKKESEGVYLAEKMLYGGVVVGKYKLTKSTLVVTLNENICLEEYSNEENKQAALLEEIIEVKGLNKKIKQVRPIEQTVNLKNADKIVAVGRGINKQEDIALIEEFANSINAQLGCSRPIAEDFKWLKLERQVGLTGTSVTPDLYVAVGISGQIQHTIGIKDAKVIVAINNNKNAPIFEHADYGIVGDLFEVVPKLKEAVERVITK